MRRSIAPKSRTTSPRALGTSLLLLVAGSALACAVGSSDDDVPAVRVVQRDSMGIKITESAAPTWEADRAWRIQDVPEVVIGSTSQVERDVAGGVAAAAPLLLQDVHAIGVLSGGRIVVADAGLAEVMVFDSSGVLLRRFGGRGEGPGELRGIVDLHVCGADSIVVADVASAHFFDGRGTYARRVPYRSGAGLNTLQGVSADCRRLLVQQRVRTPALDHWGPIEQVFAWFDPSTGTVDTIASARLLEAWSRRLYGAEQTTVVPWGTSTRTYAVRRDTLVIGYGRVPELRAYDATGAPVSLLRWSPRPQAITRKDRERYADIRAEWISGMPPNEPEVRFLFPELDEYPELPSTKPLFDVVLADDEGGVWARRFPESSFGLFDLRLRGHRRPDPSWTPFSRQTWTVFDSAGVWLGDLTLPDRFDLKAVARGRLYGVAADSLDVETVQVLRIHRPSGAPR